MVSPDHVQTPPRKGSQPKQDPRHVSNKQHDLSLLQGMLDKTKFPIANDDYYGQLGSLGFYGTDLYPSGAPWTHDVNTSSTLHFYDMSKKKTPIDMRVDVVNTHLGHAAQDYKDAELYNVQNFEHANTLRIKEKTHRILNDPSRKFQSQVLVDIQNQKAKMLKGRDSTPAINQLVVYNQMLLDVNTLLLERITDVLDYQEKILMFNKYEVRPLSKNFYCEMTLVADAEPTKIDFRDEANNRNIPSGAKIVDFPKHNLLSLQIVYDTGTEIQFATNKPINSLETTVKLKDVGVPYSISPGQFTVESLNIRAIGTNADVRLIGLY